MEGLIATGDIPGLREQSLTGFGITKHRRDAWRLVLAIPQAYNPTVVSNTSHRDYRQVKMDVERSFMFIESEKFQQHKREQLEKVIMTVLMRNPAFRYYQGFNNIAAIVLMFAREPFAVLALEALAARHLNPFLGNGEDGVNSIMNFVLPVLTQVDSEVSEFISRHGVNGMAFVQHVMTCCTYKESAENSLRFLDFFVCCHPLMPVYVVAVAISMKRHELMRPRADEGTIVTAAEYLMTGLDIDSVITGARDAFVQFPPSVVLARHKEIVLWRTCRTLSPDVEYEFPIPDRFPKDEYEKHLQKPGPFRFVRWIRAWFPGRRKKP